MYNNSNCNMKYLMIIFFLIPLMGLSQEKNLSIFNNFIGKTWKADGNWEDGSKFKQEKTFEYSLNSTIVIVNTIGYIDKARTKLGKRNYGIRQYDKKSDTIKFWEFDVFDGLTTGFVFAERNNIFYQYENGGSQITNMWEFVNDTTYNFKVGIWKNKNWEKLFLDTQFIASD